MIIIDSVDRVLPSIDALDELKVPYTVEDDGRVLIDVSDERYSVRRNADVKGEDGSYRLDEKYHCLSNGLVDKTTHRSLAFGDLLETENGDYVCNSEFRVLSKTKISTTDIVLAGQNDVEDLYYFYDKIIEYTDKPEKENKK